MASISVGDEALRELVQKAVFDSMGQPVRDKLVAEAIRSLFDVRRDHYSKQSIFEEQFASAVRDLAKSEVSKLLADDADAMTKIRAAIADGIALAFSNERRDKLINTVADAVVRAFKFDER